MKKNWKKKGEKTHFFFLFSHPARPPQVRVAVADHAAAGEAAVLLK